MNVILLVSVLALTSTATAKVDVTYESLKTFLEQKNSRVAAARDQEEAAKERKGSFARSLLPKVELFGAQESFKRGRNDQITQPVLGAEASLNIFNGGRDWNESEIRNLRADQMKYFSQKIKSEELEKVRVLYWNALYQREKIKILKSATDTNGRNIKAANTRLRNGVGTESDRLEFEMEDITLRQELEEAQLKFGALLSEIAVALNFEDHEEIYLTDQLEHEHDYKDVVNHSPKDHEFMYKETELHSEISALEARKKSFGWVPSIDAFASYYEYNQREIDLPDEADRRESVFGLKASLSLGSLMDSNRESAALQKESLGSAKLAAQQKKEIHLHVESELAELDLLHSQVHLAEENIKLAERYYKLTEMEYSRGVKNSPDVLGASNRLLEIKDKQLEIVRDFQISKAHILSKIGK